MAPERKDGAASREADAVIAGRVPDGPESQRRHRLPERADKGWLAKELEMKRCILIAAMVLVCASAQADVWRVRQNYTGGGSGGYNNMPDYIEPAAVTANAAFGGTAANDTWNSWDVDVRSGSMGGYNYILGTAIGSTGAEATETLYSGEGLTGSTVTIRSTNNSGQHNPWYGLPTTGSGFEQLTGDSHSAGVNGNSESSTYTMEIAGLPEGDLVFYSYGHRNGDVHDDIPAAYYISLNGAAPVAVARSGYAEGDAASGVLLSTTIAGDGLLTVAYTSYAGFTGPAFQFATAAPVPEPAGLGLLGVALLAMRKRRS